MMPSSPDCLAFHATLAPIHTSLPSSVETSIFLSPKRPADIPLRLSLASSPFIIPVANWTLDPALWLCIAKVEAFQATTRPSPTPEQGLAWVLTVVR